MYTHNVVTWMLARFYQSRHLNILKKYEGFIKNIFLSVVETFVVFLTVQLLLIEKRPNKGLLVARGKLAKFN